MNLHSRRPSLFAALLLGIGLVVAGWLTLRAEQEMRADLLQQARLVVQALSVSGVKALSGSEADLAKPEYQQLKGQLTAVRSANPQCRFLYLMGRKTGGDVYFFVDSESPESKDYSPPGQIYEEVTEGFRQVFDTRKAAVEGPIPDRWGVWVSALVPLTDPQTGAVVAVLGMDIAADHWKWDVAAKAALPVGLMLVLFIGVAAVMASTRVDASPKPVLRRLLPSLAVMVILLIGGAGLLLWQLHQQRLTEASATVGSDISGDLTRALDQQAAGLTAIAQPIAADPNVQRALSEGDADALLAAWQPVFETLSPSHFTHFYFFDKDRICVLRVHQPDKLGDRVERFTAVEAERTGTTTSGMELGPLGTLSLRVVQPVFASGSLVGYVELGKEIEKVLRTLDIPPGIQMAVVIRKKYLHRQAWEAGMRRLGRDSDWNHLTQSAVIYSSQGRLPDAFVPWAEEATGGSAVGQTHREIAVDGRDYQVSPIPLPDASGEEVGDLLIMRDVSADKVAFARLLTLGGAVGGVVLALVMGIIYVMLRRTDASIRAQQAALRESEQSYRNQFANNSAMMLMVDPEDGTIIDANAAALNFYGYPRGVLLGMRITEITRLSTGEIRQAMASVTREHGRRFEFQHRLADGSIRHVEVSVSNIQFGGRHLLHQIIQDITERKQAEASLEELNRQLRVVSREAGMSEVATGVLHNVGNVLNSVNISTAFVEEKVGKSVGLHFSEIATLLNAHSDRLAEYLTEDDRGRHLPALITKISNALANERAALMSEVALLRKNVAHIKDIVAMQQSYGRVLGVSESLQITDLIEDALEINAAALDRHVVEIVRQYSAVPKVCIDKHKVLQILVNLISNARYAADEARHERKQITLSVGLDDEGFVAVRVQDNGIGIDPENLTRVFALGFTTKKDGHGFGLHSSVNAARELGATLTAHSDGLGHGATFILRIPPATNPDPKDHANHPAPALASH